jgi:hypothetical protein
VQTWDVAGVRTTRVLNEQSSDKTEGGIQGCSFGVVGVHINILGNHRKVAATTNCNLGRVSVSVSQDDKGIHAMIIGSRSIAADNRIAAPDCVGDIR